MPSWLPTLIFVPLIGFGLYRRFTRTFGRQLVAPRRMVARMVLLTVVCALLVVTSAASPRNLVAPGAGVALGIVLAGVGLAHTKFEVTNAGRFYVPNGWIGIAITALFLGRLAGRIFTASERLAAVQAGASPFAGLQRSPLTLGLFCLLAGYYVSYYAGVLKKAAKLGALMPPRA
ncbi:MAG: DUF1453 domain-containing protein [Polyangiaceae bacterium]